MEKELDIRLKGLQILLGFVLMYGIIFLLLKIHQTLKAMLLYITNVVADTFLAVFDIYSGADLVYIPRLPNFITSRLLELALSKNRSMTEVTCHNQPFYSFSKKTMDLIANHPALLQIEFRGYILYDTAKELSKAVIASNTIINVCGVPNLKQEARDAMFEREKGIRVLDKAWKKRNTNPLTYVKILEIEKSLNAMKYLRQKLDLQAMRKEIADLKHGTLYAHYALSNVSDPSKADNIQYLPADIRKLIQQSLGQTTIHSSIAPVPNVVSVQPVKSTSWGMLTTAAIFMPLAIAYQYALDAVVWEPKITRFISVFLVLMVVKDDNLETYRLQCESSLKNTMYFAAKAVSLSYAPEFFIFAELLDGAVYFKDKCFGDIIRI